VDADSPAALRLFAQLASNSADVLCPNGCSQEA
jgi:hypothetical protein